MKTEYQFVLLLFVGLWCNAYGQTRQDDMPEPYDGSADDDIEFICPDNIGGEKSDPECIRNVQAYYKSHSDCVSVSGSNEPILRDSQVVYLTCSNMTVYYNESYITDLDVVIERAGIHRPTNQFILLLFFKSAGLDAKHTSFSFHRHRKMDLVNLGSLIANYSLSTLVATPYLENGNLDIDRARFSTFVLESNPKFSLSDSLTTVTDPQVSRAMNSMMTNLSFCLIDTATTETYSFFTAFMQKYICDFKKSVARQDYFRT